MSSQNDSVICLSSDESDDCCIVDDKANVKKKNKVILNSLTEDLSRIRSFTPQKSSSTSAKAQQVAAAGTVNGTSSAHTENNGTTSPEEVDLVDSDNEGFEIEYSTSKDEGNDEAIRSQKGTDDDSQAAASGGEEVAEEAEDQEENYLEVSEREVESFKQAMMDNRPRKVVPKNIEKAKTKVQNAFEAAKFLPRDAHVILQGEIRHSKECLIMDSKNYWRVIGDLLDVMEPTKLGEQANVCFNSRQEMQDKAKQKLIKRAEHKLESIRNKIEELEYGVYDSDSENEHNSPYILVEKYKKRFIDAYYKLCDITKCSRFTGRPVQKTIRLKKHGADSGYDAIDLSVEKFLNKRGFLFAPDYPEIYKIVESANRSEQLELSVDEIIKIAKPLFESIIKIIKQRRGKDLKASLLTRLLSQKNIVAATIPTPEEDDDEPNYEWDDPADNDPTLRQKLEENDKLKKSESEVFSKYSNLDVEQGNQIVEVADDVNVDESPPPSEGEEDDDDDEEGGDTDTDCTSYSNNNIANDELTEDEDEIRESLRIDRIDENGSALEDESGRSTAGESESDSNVKDYIDNLLGSGSSVIEPESIESINTGEKRKSNENLEELVGISNGSSRSPSISDEQQDQPPPLKKIKSDENSNESKISKSVLNEENINEPIPNDVNKKEAVTEQKSNGDACLGLGITE